MLFPLGQNLPWHDFFAPSLCFCSLSSFYFRDCSSVAIAYSAARLSHPCNCLDGKGLASTFEQCIKAISKCLTHTRLLVNEHWMNKASLNYYWKSCHYLQNISHNWHHLTYVTLSYISSTFVNIVSILIYVMLCLFTYVSENIVFIMLFFSLWLYGKLWIIFKEL